MLTGVAAQMLAQIITLKQVIMTEQHALQTPTLMGQRHLMRWMTAWEMQAIITARPGLVLLLAMTTGVRITATLGHSALLILARTAQQLHLLQLTATAMPGIMIQTAEHKTAQL